MHEVILNLASLNDGHTVNKKKNYKKRLINVQLYFYVKCFKRLRYSSIKRNSGILCLLVDVSVHALLPLPCVVCEPRFYILVYK